MSLSLDNLIASTALGGGYVDKGQDIVMGSDGIFVVGYTSSNDFPTTPGAYDTDYNGGSDGFVSKLDSALTQIKASTYFGGPGDDFVRTMVIPSTILLNTTLSYISGQTDGLQNTSGWSGDDIYISTMRFDLTPVGADETHTWTWKFIGNRFVVRLYRPGYVGMDIYDLNGRLVGRKSLGFYPSGTVDIDMSDLPSGKYLVHIRVGNDERKIKVITFK